MRIDNRTHWRTDHLKAFVVRVAAEELDAPQRKRLVVHFSYTRSGIKRVRDEDGKIIEVVRRLRNYSSGRASYTSGHCTIRLAAENPDKVDLAFVIAHELAHTRGMRHDMMSKSDRYDRTPAMRERYAWAEAMLLEKQVAKPKPAPNPDAKLEHARKMLRVNESKLRRYSTLVKKWRNRVKYYEHRGLAIAAIKPGEPQTN